METWSEISTRPYLLFKFTSCSFERRIQAALRRHPFPPASSALALGLQHPQALALQPTILAAHQLFSQERYEEDRPLDRCADESFAITFHSVTLMRNVDQLRSMHFMKSFSHLRIAASSFDR